MTSSSGILDLAIAETPIAIVDTETTGLSPDGDKIIELAVVRVDPGCEPEVVLDTLINPGRRVSGTEIHRITDSDVKGAPSFGEVSLLFLEVMSDCVFAAYNVYFDVKFLQAELGQVGIREFPPHLCLMYLRPMLRIGSKCTLGDACKQHGIMVPDQHVAADDALVSSQLWIQYLESMSQMNVTTFSDLTRLKRYKFTSSFSSDPISVTPSGSTGVYLKSRREVAEPAKQQRIDRSAALAEYWEALKSALSDLELSDTEIAYLKDKKQELHLEDDVMRWLHARAYAGILNDFSVDYLIDDGEVRVLQAVTEGLRELGWSPGDPANPAGLHSDSGKGKSIFGRFRE